MIKAKNNIASFFLIIIVAMPLLLPVGYLFKKLIIAQRMEYELEQGALQKLTLPYDEVQWIKKDKEILVAGKYFDLKSYKIINNTLEATGIFDQEEKELHVQYSRLMKHGKGQPSPYHSIVLKFIFNTTIPEYSATIPAPLFYTTAKTNRIIEQRIIRRCSSVVTPPPKG